VHIDKPVLEARLVKRYKRFFADVELPDGSLLTTHCPNTGTLLGCLEPGNRVWIRDSQNEARKLRYTLQAIEVEGVWVSVDTSLPNAVVSEAVEQGAIGELAGYDEIRREVKYGSDSRIDLLLQREGEDCYVEVKSTTLADCGVGLFPDAVTARGKKHLGELAGVARTKGQRAVQFFLVGRADVECFRPADNIDPAYGKALREAAQAGVELLAFRALVEKNKIEVAHQLPVEI